MTNDNDIMNLPEGKECGDCRHFLIHCQQIISCQSISTVCDWFPIRFAQKCRMCGDRLYDGKCKNIDCAEFWKQPDHEED